MTFDVKFQVTDRGNYAVSKVQTDAEQVRFNNYQSWAIQKRDLAFKVSNMVKPAPELRQMSPEARKCLYPHELDLEYFPVYSQTNCFLECGWKMSCLELHVRSLASKAALSQ